MSSKDVPELLLVDSLQFLVGFDIRVPPIYSESDHLMRCKQNPLSFGALNNLQLLFNCLQPIIGVQWFNRVREHWRLGLLEFSKFIMLLGLWRWLLLLSLLHVHHSLLHQLHHLGFHEQYLLHCWWWRWVRIIVVVVLIGGIVARDGHLMIVKRFEIDIVTEIKHSQLYASSDNDD
jgi:hypothetical protein